MYIVTGGAGFIGSAVVWELNRQGMDDILIVDNLGSKEKWKNLVPLRYRDYIHRDAFLADIRGGRWPDGVRAVIHMGACSSTTERDADFLMENNFRYSRDLCRAALRAQARFIAASSAATYGDGSLGFSDSPEMLPRLRPLNMYGYSKHLFDLWADREGLLDRLASLKFFNVYGPNEYHKGDMRSVACKAVPLIRASGRLALFRSERPDYEDGGQKRDFVHVKDCAALVVWLLENPAVNGVLNMGTGKARTWNDLARAVFTALDRPPLIEYVDMPEALKKKYQYFTEADMGWMERAGCPVTFRGLEEGVGDYVRGYLSDGEERHLEP
jgi:ADP-L-glycero-D-manno-heptose 6-epimerase